MTLATAASTDRIEKEVRIKAPISRVWRALSNAEEFGKWFGADLTGKSFVPGQSIQGQFNIPGYEKRSLELVVDRIEPETYFSYRWHPCCSKEPVDLSHETPTLVEFMLSEENGNTLLRVVESGFDSLPLERRAAAFASNSGGWAAQLGNIERYVVSQ